MLEKERALEVLEILRNDLKRLVDDNITVATSPAFARWQFSAQTAIQTIFPNKESHVLRFSSISFTAKTIGVDDLQHMVRMGNFSADKLLAAPRQAFLMGAGEADAILHSMSEEVRTYWKEDGNSLNPQGTQTAPTATTRAEDSQVVFVVHGRNKALSDSMFDFLSSIGLRPLEWSKARAATGEGSPYVGHILDRAFSMAQAVVVLMTADDEARLKKEFHQKDEPLHETELTGQARPNVLFEAGMAMGRDAKRTVLVEVGTLRSFSDVVGRHTVRLGNSVAQRQELAMRLKTAGCPVDISGTRWHTVGSFELSKPDESNSPKSHGVHEKENMTVGDPEGEALSPRARQILDSLFYEPQGKSLEEIVASFPLPLQQGPGDPDIDLLRKRNFIVESLQGSRTFYIMTPLGRDFAMRNSASG